MAKLGDVSDPPGPNRVHEVLGVAALILLSVIGGMLIERISPQSGWAAIGLVMGIVTVFVVLVFLVLQAVTRRRP